MRDLKDPFPENAKLAAEKGYRRHLYLEQLGLSLDKCYDNWIDNTDNRHALYQDMEKLYAVNPTRTWALDSTIYQWLYEHLKAYLELADEVVDLNFYKFQIDGEERTEKECINMILELLEYIILNEDNWDINALEFNNKRKKALYILAEISQYLWW